MNKKNRDALITALTEVARLHTSLRGNAAQIKLLCNELYQSEDPDIWIFDDIDSFTAQLSNPEVQSILNYKSEVRLFKGTDGVFRLIDVSPPLDEKLAHGLITRPYPPGPVCRFCEMDEMETPEEVEQLTAGGFIHPSCKSAWHTWNAVAKKFEAA